MSHDLLSQFYSCLNLPIHEKLAELTRIIDQSTPNKDLQVLFPQLINHIFASTFTSGWGLRNITYESHRYDYDNLISFLEPQGPMLRLCYKLLSDPQLKYDLPLNVLPLDLQMTLERGRCPQFYADMLATDPQTMNVSALMLSPQSPAAPLFVTTVAATVTAEQGVLRIRTRHRRLALVTHNIRTSRTDEKLIELEKEMNPFDYYIFNFALHLVNNSQNKSSWENWNSVYFALACDYLLHFLPVDPNMPVLPHIPNYTGKVPMAAPLQTANRPYSPSLLLMSDLSGAIVSNQHQQTQSRNEVWRSETVLQVFIDIWMSVDQFNGRSLDMYHRSITAQFSSPERVRTVRVLVKHLHSFSAKHFSEPAIRSSTLRKYSRQIMCARGYLYIRHLVTNWPLDASFRLVMELWLSLIQPWRYVNNCISREINPNNNQDKRLSNTLDASFTQFIAENFPSYTCIFQLVLPRFMRLDLTAHKNAVMLFRLGKVFSQPHLVPILKNLEQAVVDSGSSLQHSPDNSLNNSGYDHNQSYSYNGVALQKWVAVAKQAISELNLSTNFEYEPIWSDNSRQLTIEFVRKILKAKTVAEKHVEESTRRLSIQQTGFWSGIMEWLMLNGNEENNLLEEIKKVPTYLNTSVHYFCNIFALNEINLVPSEPIIEETSEHSSFENSSNFPHSITNKLRSKSAAVSYMGDPDLMPITTYESTILVRILYQITARINELYQQQFTSLWNRNDFCGHVAKEILQKPCRIQSYVKHSANYQSVVSEELPPRVSLRRLGSHAFLVWFGVGYMLCRMFSYSGLFYVLVLVTMWLLHVLTRASLKLMKIM